jgi:hypothetical protein
MSPATSAGFTVTRFVGEVALAALVGMFTEETLAKFKLIAESMLTKADFLSEDLYSGDTAPVDGRYVFVKHVRCSSCKDPHQGLVENLKKGDPITPSTSCGQPGIFMRVTP